MASSLPPLMPVRRKVRRAAALSRPLRVVSFLAPRLFWFYEFVADALGRRLGVPIEVMPGTSYAELADCDVAFVCGLAYVEMAESQPLVEPIAAPILTGARYQNRPIYFSDVIVRRDCPGRSFGDLRGCRWAYNEVHSQSGYGITRHELVRRGATAGFFGQVIEAGWHDRAIDMVLSGQADAAAVDSHVLTLAMQQQPELAQRLRVIDSLGPSTIQPVVAARRLSPALKTRLRRCLIALADDPEVKTLFVRALVDRFVAVNDQS